MKKQIYYELKSDKIIEGTENWDFVNDIAVSGNKVYAATSEGLYQYENNTLTSLIDTVAYNVEVTPNGTVLAVVGTDVFLIKDGKILPPFVAVSGLLKSIKKGQKPLVVRPIISVRLLLLSLLELSLANDIEMILG